MRLGELGEFGLLAELERRGLVSGIADDAAQLAGGLVATHDTLVEGVHFRLDWISWLDLGYRAAAVNLSDLAASAAAPDALLVSLALPRETRVEDVVELYEGLNDPGIPIVGGDTTAAERLTIGVTALGHSDRVPGRAGALPGDAVVITGPLGGAGAAFREKRFVRPVVRVCEGKRLGAVAHAMLDVSDGIAADAGHIAARSGCRVVIDVDRIQLAERATVEDLAFGEDYELLAATLEPLDFQVIGSCEEGSGVEIHSSGRPVRLTGWDHFH
jgi:thiamine-monophosphate kinase